MKKDRIKKWLSTLLAVSITGTIAASAMTAERLGAQDPEVYELTDSSVWQGDASVMDILGDTMTLGFAAGVSTTAVHTGKKIGNELVEFKAKFNLDPSDGWVGIRLRNNEPALNIWDNKQAYVFMVRVGRIELMKYNNTESSTIHSVPLDLNDGKEHVVRVGAYDQGDKTYLYFAIDGEQIMLYEDDQPLTLKSSYLSFNTYGATTTVQCTVKNDGGSGIVERSPSAGDMKTLKKPDDWYVNQLVGGGPDQAKYAKAEIEDGKVTLTGEGTTTYRNALQSKSFSFQASVQNAEGQPEGYADIMFLKGTRDSIYGDSTYALRIFPNGKFNIIRYSSNNAQILPGYDTGLDFTQEHTFRIDIIKTGDIESEIYVYIDSETQAYKYRDKKYSPNLQVDAFFAVHNSNPYVTSTVRNIQFIGKEVLYTSEETVKPVFYADYMVEEGGEKFLHWMYRSDFGEYKGVSITDVQGKEIGFVHYPDRKFVLPNDHTYTKLYLVAVSAGGKKADKILVDLKQKRSQYYKQGEMERIIVNPGDQYAGFIEKESGKPFISNGVNYIGLRYGDHATFEPEMDFIPAAYDPYTVETMFMTLAKHGYNTVRVFVSPGVMAGNPGLAGNPETTTGIYIPYMENIVDFLRRAKKYGIYVLPNMRENEIVGNNYFRQLSGNTYQQTILFSQDGLNAKAKMLTLFLKYIQERDASLLNVILAMQMQNEFAFYNSQAPFTQTSGTYTFLDGTKYDMSDNTQRRELALAAARLYYKTMKEAVRSVVPDMMICEGSFTLQGVGKNISDPNVYGINPAYQGDNRFPLTIEEYLSMDIDFLDIHVYRYGGKGNGEQIFANNMASMKLDTELCKELRKSKPIILGEYGAFVGDPGEETFDKGMQFAKALQNEAMKAGFSGALLWTMDSFEQVSIYHLMDENGKYLPYMSLIDPS